MARIKLGELLVRAGVLDEFKLKAALAEQQRWGGRLGRILVDMNFVSEDILVKALSKQLGIPRAKLDALDVPFEILTKLDAQFAIHNAICPERYVPERKTLVVAMADPTNVGAVDELRFKTGLRIETSLAGELEIAQGIDRLFYGRGPVDGIDLSAPPRSATIQDPAHKAALAASGLPFEIPDAPARPDPLLPLHAASLAPAPVSGFQPAPPPQAMPTQSGAGHRPPWVGPPSLAHMSGPGGSTPSLPYSGPSAAPIPTPSASAPPPQIPLGSRPPSGTTALDVAAALEGAQRKQIKAIRVMLELLIEKGVFSRDEYMQLVSRR